jgi:hypothetical protein
MAQQGDKVTVFFMLGVMAFAVILVDDRWTRALLALLPMLLVAQRALTGTGVGDGATGAASRPRSTRQQDTKRYIEELLKHFKEFYATCHLMAGGQLDPSEAKDLAGGIEKRLNSLLAEVTDAARDAE